MFDLPVETEHERKNYRQFRKFLIKNGFLMLQESIYCKIAQNPVAADSITDNIKKNKPDEGLVQILRVTEKQFQRMEFIVGEANSEILNSDKRLIIL